MVLQRVIERGGPGSTAEFQISECRLSRRLGGRLEVVELQIGPDPAEPDDQINAAGADPGGTLGEDHRPEVHVIPRAIDAALGRGTFAIYGADYETPDGTCLRDYVHVSDLAAAHLLALDSLRAGGESAAYNLGNGRPTSVREVVDAVERVTGRPVPVTVGPRRAGDPAVLYASSDRIRRSLGWTPGYEDIDVIVETAWRWREAIWRLSSDVAWRICFHRNSSKPWRR